MHVPRKPVRAGRALPLQVVNHHAPPGVPSIEVGVQDDFPPTNKLVLLGEDSCATGLQLAGLQ